MAIDLVCDLKNPPIGALVVVELIKSKNPVKVEWSAKEASIKYSSNTLSCVTNNDILRALAREASSYQLYGTTPIERTQIDHWLTYCLNNDASIEDALQYLNKCLAPLTYLVANKLTIADLAVFNEFFAKYEDLRKTGLPTNVQRWYDLISALPQVQAVLKSLPKDAKLKKTQRDTAPSSNIGDRKQEGKFVDLPGAEMGKVVVRFPPEASGFLHIGHAKAALLNQYYQQAFQGKLIMRFDDTNPAKEKEDFEKVILEDLEMLEIKPDLFTHTSQYFDLMLEYCETMLKEGKAYVDDTEPEQMKIERDLRTESKNRSNSVDKNFEMWREMVKGSAAGQKCCVRAKIDMSSPNGCMRDPTIYRCKNEPHPRTGTQYKTYPTYDFACPIVDAIENVTHTLRTMEYHDRDDQFYWFIDALKLRKPYIWEYARLNMTNTVLSKRKLTWFVEEGLVDGWDDPRFPTVRGVFRRGMTVEGLKQFIIAQGSSKSVVFMEWDKIWAFNKKVIDPVAPRYTALENQNQVIINVAGAKLESIQVPLHPKNNDVGMKTVWMGPQVLVDYADAECLQEGENATFINWGNLMINKINKTGDKITSVDATLNLDNKDYKKTLKLTWLCKLAPSEYPPTFCVYFEHIISKAVLGRDEDFKNYIGHETRSETAMMGDPELKNLKKGAIIQLQRRGYFKVDQAYGPASEFSGVERPVVLFFVPDGHTKEMPTSGGPIKKNVAAENKAQVKPASVGQASDINEKINLQGESVRNLKAQKAAKADIDAAVKLLLELKAEYKKATGSEWKPGTVVTPAAAQAKPASTGQASDINEKINLQGESVRNLKAQKAAKTDIDAAVKLLLELKGEYKKATGSDWKPSAAPAAVAAPVVQAVAFGQVSDINEKINLQGESVRTLKAAKAAKGDIDAAVKLLLELKGEYKKATGSDWKPGTVVAPANPASVGQSSDLNEKINLQGETVRNLKGQKAAKADIDAAVKILLQLKGEFKTATGADWKPSATPAPATAVAPVQIKPASVGQTSDINEKINLQGESVRTLKAAKAAKGDIDAAVKILLELKGEYKKATGSDWKPSAAPAAVAAPIVKAVAFGQTSDINEKINLQGESVRTLKAAKAAKGDIDAAVKILLELKGEYKKATGSDWKPGTVIAPAKPASAGQSSDLNEKINLQGDAVRTLKGQKAAKADIDAAVKLLLELKGEYKTATGTDWKPAATPAPVVQKQNKENMAPIVAPVAAAATNEDPRKVELTNKITEQGNVVRTLKTDKSSAKPLVDAAVKLLLDLKSEYKTLTGTDFPVAGRAPAAPKAAKTADKVEKKKPEPKKAEVKEDGSKKQTRLGMEATKEENLPDWYSQIITKGELIEYYDVSGCYILRPWSFGIWKAIKNWFDAEITRMGVKECYFPIFVSKAALEREKAHIADFAPEVAWVTKSGDSDLAEPIAVRPTSETVMYPAYAKWIQSYRDLPIRLNQWNNVVRWEFKHPQPFLRTREFLWQEGHTAFATAKEAQDEVLEILELYKQVYTDLMAIPVIKGRKTEKEKFAGGDFTTTVEAFISASGRAIQGATSHYLGQNFSKMFEIVFEDPETKEKQYVFQNSWGITTRTIGVMVMVHADNKGLVLPPNVACVQAVIVPCGITAQTTEAERVTLIESCKLLEGVLSKQGVRVEGDYRDNYSPGWKYNHWEVKGVPIRIELGPKDLKSNQLVAVRRDTGEKVTMNRDQATTAIPELLKTIHNSMLAKATKDLNDHVKVTKSWTEFTTFLDDKNIIMSPFCGDIPCEERIKAESAREETDGDSGAPAMGAKSLCIPFDQPTTILAGDKCVHPACTNKPKSYCLFGRSY